MAGWIKLWRKLIENGHFKMPGKLSTIDIQRFYNHLIALGRAPATVRRNHQIIHSCLDKAKATHLISRNPCEGVTLPKLDTDEARAMTKDEMDRFLIQIQDPNLATVWLASFLLALGTGLREGEVLALTWDNIDLRNQTLSVKHALARTTAKGLMVKTPKSKKSKRVIPLPREVVILLRLHRMSQRRMKLIAGNDFKKQSLVFCSKKGTHIIPRNFTRKFYELRERAGLTSDVNLHGLRHTYATRLLERGESLKTVQEL